MRQNLVTPSDAQQPASVQIQRRRLRGLIASTCLLVAFATAVTIALIIVNQTLMGTVWCRAAVKRASAGMRHQTLGCHGSESFHYNNLSMLPLIHTRAKKWAHVGGCTRRLTTRNMLTRSGRERGVDESLGRPDDPVSKPTHEIRGALTIVQSVSSQSALTVQNRSVPI
ncbi:unnamed protein product [Protopolystoma xenopodis]|uniref:Uncharacterized protein n=1 Tax=Protopolystoma xenopodis TaxID=117903 RepID=A0A448WHV1_9PLAT|nr:unnamed protein product [Protopolystoma xenopodis]